MPHVNISSKAPPAVPLPPKKEEQKTDKKEKQESLKK
jgi:hypothetical protein